MSNNLPDDVSALILTELPAETRRLFEIAYAQRDNFKIVLAKAVQSLADAEAHRAGLAERAAAGADLTPAMTAAASRAASDAVAHLEFCTEALDAAERALVARERDMVMAHTDSFRPVLLEGVRMRIAASIKVDEANAALAVAMSQYALGTHVIRTAQQTGLRLPLGVIAGPLNVPGVSDRPTSAIGEANLWRAYLAQQPQDGA